MPRVEDDVVRPAALHDFTLVHHQDLPGQLPDDTQVVGDEQVGDAVTRLQPAQQFDDLRLYSYVQGADGLVADDELRFQRQRPGDADALALAPGELERVAVGHVRPELDLFQQLHGLVPLRHVQQAVLLQSFRQDVHDRHARVQRGIGVLEDHLQVAPPGFHAAFVQAAYLRVLKDNAAVIDGLQADNGPSQGGLPRAGFPHQAHRCPPGNGQVDIVHGLDVTGSAREQAFFHREPDPQVFNL